MAKFPEKFSFATHNTVLVSSSDENHESHRNDVSQIQSSERPNTVDAKATSLDSKLAKMVTRTKNYWERIENWKKWNVWQNNREYSMVLLLRERKKSSKKTKILKNYRSWLSWRDRKSNLNVAGRYAKLKKKWNVRKKKRVWLTAKICSDSSEISSDCQWVKHEFSLEESFSVVGVQTDTDKNLKGEKINGTKPLPFSAQMHQKSATIRQRLRVENPNRLFIFQSSTPILKADRKLERVPKLLGSFSHGEQTISNLTKILTNVRLKEIDADTLE